MAKTDYVEETVDSNGNKVKTVYDFDTDQMAFTTLGEDIKDDFNFITSGSHKGSLIDMLNDLKGQLKEVCSIGNAFYFDNGSNSVSDLLDAYQDVANDIEDLIESLPNLKNAIDTDIDNVNAELKNNYGKLVRFKKGSIKKQEITEQKVS